MRVTRYEGDKNLRELTRRLFEAEGPEAALTAAADSLAEANPDLPLRARGPLSRKVEADAVIAVPDVPGTTHTRGSEPIGDAAVTALLERARAGLGQLAKDAEAERQRSAAALEESLELIGSRGFKAAAKRDEELAAALAGVQEHAKARLKELAGVEEDQRLVLEGADRAIDDLVELANRPAAGREAPEG